MKKLLTLGAALSLLSTSAFASKARLIALGENQDGSFFIEDNRNIFLNPAMVMTNKDIVTMEWGNSGNQTTGTGSSDTTPNSEAGVIYSTGTFVYGLHLGSESKTYNDLRFQNGGTLARTTAVDNAVDFFVAGSADFNWGVNLTYSDTQDETALSTLKEQKLMTVKIGIQKSKYDAFLHIATTNEAEDTSAGDKFEGDSDFKVGGSYQMNLYRVYGSFRKADYKIGTTDNKDQVIQIGAGRNKKINDKATLFSKAELIIGEEKGATKDKSRLIPVSVGIESAIKPWMVLRGSVGTFVMSENKINGSKQTPANATNVNVGASFIFGELNIDGLIGTGNDGDGAGTQTTTTAGEQGILTTDNLMTRIALTYKF
jgi:hypothetical protein